MSKCREERSNHSRQALIQLIRRVALAIGLASLLVYLALPLGRVLFEPDPSSTPDLKFIGFISLPKSSEFQLLSVFDYLTIEGRNLYAATIKPGSVYKIPLSAGALPTREEITAMPGEPSAHGIAFDTISHLGFVSRSNVDTVDVFNPQSMRIVKRIPVPKDVDGIFSEPEEHLIYAVHGARRAATIIDPASRKIVGSIPLGGEPEFAAFDANTHLIYQNLTDTNTVAVVDVLHRKVLSQWPLQGCVHPSGMALDAHAHRLLIACQGNDVLAVFDLGIHRVLTTMPIGGGPDSVSYDPVLQRIYTTGRSGMLSIITQLDPDRYSELSRIHLAFGAHTLAVDVVTHRIYVGYVSLFRGARMAVFEGRKRNGRD